MRSAAATRHLVGAGLAGAMLPLAACGSEASNPAPAPTGISIAPSSAAPSAPPTSPPSGSASSSPTATGATPGSVDAVAAVEAAESAVADSTAVEVSSDDDRAAVAWEVVLRAGANGRELRIGNDGAVLDNQSHRLSQAQLGDAPAVAVREAIRIAEERVGSGDVTDAELTRENNRLVWDVSVEKGAEETEVWIDAASGAVVREERD